MSAIVFDRKPYTVRYQKDGEWQSIRRRPPPKLHQMLPGDKVELTRSKNADFQQGDEFSVESISPRQPNTLKLKDSEGVTTFVDYFDLRLEQMVAQREGLDPRELPKSQKYLLWP